MNAQLILENGARFDGKQFGFCKEIAGEVVFTTSMTGYQEAITDPSFAGQIVTMTYPLVGNYGINLEDMEADKAHLSALVVREKCDYPSNFRNEMTLNDFLCQQGIMGIEGVDTRALTRTIRDYGTMKGIITTKTLTDEQAKDLFASLNNSNVVAQVTTKESYVVNPSGKHHVALIDLGVKSGILKSLKKRDCKITVLPYNVQTSDIEALNPDMVFVSNGPGNPSDIPEVVDTVRALIGKFPICGICTGHVIIGLALGGKLEKLKFGHHGGNHPVKDTKTGKVYITSQGHNYIITDLPEDVTETFINVNDGTNEGLAHKTLPIQSVQFHPEAAPGPLESSLIFDQFLKGVK